MFKLAVRGLNRGYQHWAHLSVKVLKQLRELGSNKLWHGQNHNRKWLEKKHRSITAIQVTKMESQYLYKLAIQPKDSQPITIK
jgi:hypothetical protein